MTKPFNWNYKTAHKLGRSHVADAKSEAYATFTAKPCDLDEPLPRAKRTHEMTDAEWEEANA